MPAAEGDVRMEMQGRERSRDDARGGKLRATGTMIEAQVDAVYRHAPITHSATALVAVLTVLVMHGTAERRILLPWAAAVVALSALRLVDYSRYLAWPAARRAQSWATRYRAGALASGILWG